MRLKHTFIIMMLLILLFSSKSAKAFDKNKRMLEINAYRYSVFVDVPEFKLYLIDIKKNRIIKICPIAGGKPSTPSPYGTWTITEKKENWGAGFGSRWMMLDVPWGKYGIHGTNKPLTISSPDSLGCIRMFNKDIEMIYDYVGVGSKVTIYGGYYGSFFRKLNPGDRGADVTEVQTKLKSKGYYNGEIDGIYGEALKKSVIKYRKDNKLENSHVINQEFYSSIGIFPFE